MSPARLLGPALLALALGAAAAPPAAEAQPAGLRLAGTSHAYRYEGALPKAAPAPGERRTRVGSVRASPKDFADPPWQAVPGGYAARFDAVSAGAHGLRARLDLGGAAGTLELRVRGDDGRVEAMAIPAGAREAWGPWTGGERQAIEVFSREPLAAGAVRLGAVVHFDRPLEAKAAGSCTLDTPCSTGNAVLDAAIAERKKSIARISFVDGTQAFVCTGTLLDSGKHPTPYFLTANHCVGRAAVASSVTSFWFYEATGCGSGAASPDFRQVAGGMAIEFADPNTDHTLLVMNAAPPAGAAFSPWNPARLLNGQSVVSLSHPAGDVSKWAEATVSGTTRFPDWEQFAWLTTFSRGIVQGGSSGSGLFTLSGATLELRAILSATTVNGAGTLSCTNPDSFGVYNRFDVFQPEVARRLLASPPPVEDDHGDRITEATPIAAGAGETTVAGRIDYPGDTDVFRVTLAQKGTLVARAAGGMDTVGVLLDANGERIDSNDDAETRANDFGLTNTLEAGTYYLAVTRWESAGTGPYALTLSLSPVTANYTDLWWNPAESGWGINLNHQGAIVFATLFTYGADGAPDWFVMSRGERQPDGSFRGELYRARGPVFHASPWSPITLTPVGTMQVAFPSENAGRLDYTVDGVAVTKSIERQRFSTPTACAWSAFDRSYAGNYQDLWWNPAESGWGVNFAHQGDIVFATLFTYEASGRSAWFVMSRGDRVPGTRSFQGTLYRTSGPPFDANPWRPIALAPVGSMQVSFGNGNSGTLSYTIDGIPVTKPITRQVFASPAPQCASDD
ncbi:MAG: DVUA0089 family protein [Burkholderiales bacterium]